MKFTVILVRMQLYWVLHELGLYNVRNLLHNQLRIKTELSRFFLVSEEY